MATRSGWSDEKFDLLFPADFYVDPAADFGPFGSDPGWDLFEELKERRGKARRSVRAAITVEEDPDVVVANAEEGDDYGDALIVDAAFAVICLSGQIDAEGLAWVRAVLLRWKDRDGGCPEADTMLADLERFESLDPALLEQMDVETLRTHLGLPKAAPLGRGSTASGLGKHWLFMYPDPPEPTTTRGRWGSSSNVLRDPLYRALQSPAWRLQEVARRAAEGGFQPPAGHVLHWFSQSSAHLGSDFRLEVWILIGRERPRRSYRRTRNERSISVPVRPVTDDLHVDAVTADALVLGALEDAADFLAKKEGLSRAHN